MSSQKFGAIFRKGDPRIDYAGGHWLEGPSQGPDGLIYFSDITQSWATSMQGGHLNVFDSATGETKTFLSPSAMSNGIVFDSRGRMVVAHGADFGGRYVSRIDMDTRRSTIIAGLFNGRPFNAPNDVDVDAKDQVYFTDPRYFGHEPVEQPVMGVYRVNQDNEVELVIADCSRPNGLAVSPNGKHLYVVENNFIWHDRRLPGDFTARYTERLIVRYDIGTDGEIGNRQIFADFAAENIGAPDGIEVDSEGNVFAAVMSENSGVKVYAPNGEGIAWQPLPLKPANLTLAREEDGRTRMYVTATSTLFSIPVRAEPRHF